MKSVHVKLLAAVVMWGWSFVATKVVLEYMSPVEVIGLRLLIGLPILATIVLKRRIRFEYKRREWLVVVAASLVLAFHFVIQITGLIETSATNTGWIISVTPAVIALMSFLFLREKLSPIQIGGILVATLGIVFLVSKGEFSRLDWLSSTGDWLVLGSAFTWAIYTVLTRNISQQHSPLGVSYAIMLFAAIPTCGYMFATTDFVDLVHLPPEPIAAILFLGIFCQAVAFWFWQEGVSKVGASKAGFFLYLEPVATTVLAVPYLGEYFGLFTAVGGGMVLLGVYLTERTNSS
ncbi:MAG: DMT family transporter [bacterium]|nr:DMT family transporter [bacterium]